MKFAVVLTALYILFCLLTFKHFGITSDEYVEYQSGKALLHYYQTGNESKSFNISERQLPTESTYFRGHLALFSVLNPKGLYENYHLLNMLLALPLFLMFYALLLHTYKDQKLAFAGTFILFFTPRFLGDIAANPKDVPFAIFYFLSLGAIYLFHQKKQSFVLSSLVIGLLIGLTFSFRLIGASLFIVMFFYYSQRSPVHAARDVAVSFIVASASLVFLLPLFSQGYAEGLKILLASSTNFEYWNNKMLFMGKFLSKEQRPFYYLPVWILITTPLYQLLLLTLSPALLYFQKTKRSSLYYLFGFAFLVNFALYFLIEPVIYNGLRHFLFLLPLGAFLASLAALDSLSVLNLLTIKFKYISLTVFIILFLITVISVTKSHPYEYVYFNEVSGGLKNAVGNYDTDYWGASYKEMSEWLLKNPAKTRSIKVYTCDMPFAVSYYSKKLFQVVSSEEDSDFIVCDIDNVIQKDYDLPTVYSVSREGVPLGKVFDSSALKK